MHRWSTVDARVEWLAKCTASLRALLLADRWGHEPEALVRDALRRMKNAGRDVSRDLDDFTDVMPDALHTRALRAAVDADFAWCEARRWLRTNGPVREAMARGEHG